MHSQDVIAVEYIHVRLAVMEEVVEGCGCVPVLGGRSTLTWQGQDRSPSQALAPLSDSRVVHTTPLCTGAQMAELVF